MQRMIRRTWRLGGLAAVLVATAVACSSSRNDPPALQAYLEALRLGQTGGSVEAQVQQVDRCIALLPTAADCLTLRGNLRMDLYRPREARDDYDRSIAIGDHPWKHFDRADALCALGEYQGALRDLDIAVAGQPWQNVFYVRRAQARLAVGRTAEARADLQHGGALVGGYPGAELYFAEGRFSDAIAVLDALDSEPNGHGPHDYEWPHVLHMLSYVALDQPERALADFDRSRMRQSATSPTFGYEFWFVPHGCENAFVVTRSAETITRARKIFAAAEEQRVANDGLKSLREHCPSSLTAQLDPSKPGQAAWVDLAHLLTDGLLSENEEKCAYDQLNVFARDETQAKELFATRIAPVLADSPRGTDHADRWLTGQAELLFQQVKRAAMAKEPDRRKIVPPVPHLRPWPFWIDRSGDGSLVVELESEENGTSVKRTAPASLQVLDEHGIITAKRVAERQECIKTTVDEDECEAVAEYKYSGRAPAPFSIALESKAKVIPLPLERTAMSPAAQRKHLAATFSNVPAPTPKEPESYSWTPAEGSDWVERRTRREEYRPDWYRVATTPTGLRLADCSLSVNGPLTEFACEHRRGTNKWMDWAVYLGSRRIGGHDDPALGPSLRYAATIDGTTAYFFIVDWNSVPHVHVAFRVNNAWFEDTIASGRLAD